MSFTKRDSDRTLGISFLINTSFVALEFIAGLFANSLALVSDAAHNLTDSFSILLAYLAEKIGKKKGDSKRTFGYGRIAVIAATINAAFLIATSVFIFSEAYSRLSDPQAVKGGAVVVIASIGIISNGTIALLTSKNRKELNSKAVFMNNLVDTISSIGAVVAGLVILITRKTWADSVISFGIGILLLFAAFQIMKEALAILLEEVPKNIDAKEVKKSILALEHIKGIDDLHIWTSGNNEAALSCHLIVEECSTRQASQIISKVKNLLKTQYGISHATIEPQVKTGPHDGESTEEGL